MKTLFTIGLSTVSFLSTLQAAGPMFANGARIPTQPQEVIVNKTDHFQASIYQGLGYRYDHQTTKIYYFDDPSILNTIRRLKGRNSVELTLGMDLTYDNFFFMLQGDYGWAVNGTQSVVNPGNNLDEPMTFTGFKLGSGYTADAQVAIGYQLQLAKTEHFKFSLVPGVGYKYWHMMNWREGEIRFDLPTPPVVLPPGVTGFALDRQQSPDQQDWFGVYLQAGLNFHWFEKAKLDLFYQYHFMNLRDKSTAATDVSAFFPGDTLVAQQTYRFDIHSFSDHVFAQVGGLNFAYFVNPCWKLGLQFEGSHVWSHHATTKIKTIKQEFILPPVGLTETQTHSKTRISWTSYKANFYVGYAF